MRTTISSYIRNNRATLLCIGVCLSMSLVLTLISRNSLAFTIWYAKNISPLFVNTLGRLFSFPYFSFFEFFLLIIGVALLLSLIRFFYLLVKSPKKAGKSLVSFLQRAVCIASVLLLIFTFTASINYSRPALAAGYDSSVREYSKEELLGLALLLIDDVNDLSTAIDRNGLGLLELQIPSMGEAAVDAMKNLDYRFNALEGYYSRPKPVIFSKAMSYLGITGIFSPFTVEANYNSHVPSYIIPYTICHELAHLKGFMREDEAGFLAYLACKNSPSLQFQYSGALNALQYTMNQLYRNWDGETYNAVYMTIAENVRNELKNNGDYWKDHTITLTKVARTANDKYLAANAQSQGTNSYGMMVDLLLKEYEPQIDKIFKDQPSVDKLDKYFY